MNPPSNPPGRNSALTSEPVTEPTVEIPTVETVGTRIGPYKLMEKLGEGGMGEVYLAEDAQLDRKVALKLLPTRFTQDADLVRRFLQEAKTASALNHPSIITIHEIGESGGSHYIATEYIQGQTLRTLMAHSRLPIDALLDIAIQAASALSAAHQAGIIHRDIKPENLMVRPDGLVKILDFGIAKLTEAASPKPDVDQTAPGMIMGTISYMSPEQIRGLPIDTRTDIFSFGVMLYEVVAGKPPFHGFTQAEIIAALLGREPAPLSQRRAEAPPELEQIISKALAKDRDARYQKIDEMLAELKELKQEREFQQKLERSGKSSSPDHTTGPVAAHDTGEQSVHQTTSSTRIILSELKRHKGGAALLLGVVAVALLGAGYWGYRLFGGGADSGITSLAVLPFINTSNDPEKEYLADGISESLINQLSQLPGMKVIANSSSARYKGKQADPQEVARALDITGVLTGRISQRGDNLTVSVELIDGRDNTQVWGEQYSRRAADLLSVQGEISRMIAEKLRLRLSAGQQQQLAKREEVKPEAYELLLRGYAHRSRGRAEDRQKAAEYFQQAIDVDPQYGLAYAELSDIYRSLVGSGLLDPREYTAKARAAARKAIELDEGLGEAHFALANMETFVWEWENAERDYQRAIELNPNLALAHRWYASYLMLMNRHDEAISEIKLARELDPLSVGLNATVGYVLYFGRRYDGAIDVLNTTREMNKDYPYTHLFLGFTYAAKGMNEQAISSYQEAIRLGLDTPSTQIFLGAAYAQAGESARAQAILKRLQTGNAHISDGQLAILYAALGEREAAFSSLEKAYEARDLQLQYLGASPGYDSLRSDPRFENLLQRIGLKR